MRKARLVKVQCMGGLSAVRGQRSHFIRFKVRTAPLIYVIGTCMTQGILHHYVLLLQVKTTSLSANIKALLDLYMRTFVVV